MQRRLPNEFVMGGQGPGFVTLRAKTTSQEFHYKLGKRHGYSYVSWHIRDDGFDNPNYEVVFKRKASRSLKERAAKKQAADVNFLAAPYERGFMDAIHINFKRKKDIVTGRQLETMQQQSAAAESVAPIRWQYEPVQKLEKPEPLQRYYLMPMSFQFGFEMSLQVSPQQVSVRGTFHQASPQVLAEVDSMELEAASVLSGMAGRQ